MKRIVALSTLLIGTMFLTSLVAVPAASAQTDAAVYTEADDWGIGQTIGLKWNWGDMPDATKEQIKTLLGYAGLDVTELGLSIDAAFYAVLAVDDITDDEYVMSAKMAIKFAAAGNIDMSGVMPKAGNYNISLADIDLSNVELRSINASTYEALGIGTENKAVTLDLAMDFALIIGGKVIMEKDTLDIKSMDLTLKAAAVISFDAKNIPEIPKPELIYSNAIIPTNILFNISYDNYDVDVRGVFDANLNVEFEPALNIYKFPMELHDTWAINSNATISGGMKGFLDVTGLPKESEDKLFGEEGFLSEAGFTGFPIIFDDLELGDLVVKDGKLNDTVTKVEGTVTVIDNETRDVFGTDKQVFVLEAEINDETVEYYYSSELINVFASINMGSIGEFVPVDLKMLAEIGMTYDKKDVTTYEEAADGIESVENYQSTVAKKANGESDLPLMAILAVVIVVVVIAACALIIFRTRK